MPLGTSFGYPVATADELGLTDYFRKNPKVAGMAWGGGLNGSSKDEPRVIVANPFNAQIAKPEKMQGLIKIEAALHLMDEAGYTPEFDLSKEQQEWRKNLGKYATDDFAAKKSVVARLVGNDDVPGVTPEQKAEAMRFNALLDEKENPDFVKAIAGKLNEGGNSGADLLKWAQRNVDFPVEWRGVEDAAGVKSYGKASFKQLVDSSLPTYTAATSDEEKNKALSQFSNQLQNYVVGLSETQGTPATPGAASQLLMDVQSLGSVKKILESYAQRSPDLQEFDLLNEERAAVGMPLLGQRAADGTSELMNLRQKYRTLARPHGPDMSWGVEQLKKEIALLE